MNTNSCNHLIGKSNILLATCISLLQGLAGWLVQTQGSQFGFHLELFWLSLFNGVLAGGLCLQLLMKNTLRQREWLMAAGTGLLFTVTSWWSLEQWSAPFQHGTRNKAMFELFPFLLLLAYVLIPYLQSWHNRQDGRLVYHDLYRHSWDNFFIVLIGLLLTGIFWLLIALWAGLFEMLRIHFFERVFFSKPFAWLSTFVVLGLGITIGISNDRIIGSLRNIALAICRFMMPLTAIITVLFTVALAFTGLKPVWNTSHASPILLVLVAANVFFLNGVYQDGDNIRYARPLRWLTNLSVCMLPVLVSLAAYSTALRIDQHGLTPSRLYAVLITVVATCYAIRYPWSVVRSGNEWLPGLRNTNLYTGLLICTLIVATHSPAFSPAQISAWHQYQRLASSKVDAGKFDYGALKYKLGKPGKEYLEKIRALERHPQQTIIAERLRLLDDTLSYNDWQAYMRDSNKNQVRIEVIGEGKVPPNFHEALNKYECSNTCYLLLADINTDSHQDVILFAYDNGYGQAFMLVNGHWARAGQYRPTTREHFSRKELKRLHSESGTVLEVPAYRNLRLGDKQWNYQPD